MLIEHQAFRHRTNTLAASSTGIVFTESRPVTTDDTDRAHSSTVNLLRSVALNTSPPNADSAASR